MIIILLLKILEMKQRTIVVGAGPMAIEYGKVLKAMDISFSTIGNTKKGALDFEEVIGDEVILGGIGNWLENNPQVDFGSLKAIVAVNENLLGKITRELINAGFNQIFINRAYRFINTGGYPRCQ